MKLIIAGSRTVNPSDAEIDAAFDPSGLLFAKADVTAVVCGMAKGCDLAGARWAKANGIAVIEMPVTEEEYATYGKYIAPKRRNRRMAEEGDIALIFWDGLSGGSADMTTRMVARGKPVRVIPTKRVGRARKAATK